MSNYVVTISREYGSGGHEIGEKLAKELGIPFYDKELLKLAAEKSGIKEAVLKEADEAVSNPLFAPYYQAGRDPGTLNDRLFKMESDIIQEKANQESCIIIGRCGNYVLSEQPNSLHVFIYANPSKRIERIMSRHNIDNREIAAKLVKKTDKRRASYYQFYTDLKWGRSKGHDLLIDSGKLGIDNTVALLKYVVESQLKKD